MNDLIDSLECPTCAVRFDVRQATAAGKFVCPHCGQEIARKERRVSSPSHRAVASSASASGEAGNASSASSTRSAFDDLPAPVQYDERVLPPRKRYFKSLLRSIRARRNALLGMVAIGLLAAVLVGVGSAVYSARETIRNQWVDRVLPKEELPIDVLGDHGAMVNRLVERVGSIEDLATRDEALANLRAYLYAYDNLAIRAIAIGPQAEDDYSSLGEMLDGELPRLNERVRESCGKLIMNRSLVGSSLQNVLTGIMEAEKEFANIVSRAWRPIPVPASESERTCQQMKRVRYRVWSDVMSVRNKSEFRSLDASIDAAADELESMLVKRFADRRTSTSNGDAAASQKYADDLLATTEAKFKKLSSKFDGRDVEGAFRRYVDSARALDNVHKSGVHKAADHASGMHASGIHASGISRLDAGTADGLKP
tara:strand:- start:17978 stop:19255 length:1278 start_codon:yes stop_codon:yes gene_type:complete